eukprot:CAMPEP_0174259170 /NCGR_PEP_ID=MMETSP0439-20130205/8043_1 /TAXON_ID=0 /ORGANISM="Stereomyxa ramosa, Strain Chinc5" /LENGTH=455 /DNA_ID=CAMNT_0015342965 /DNA_START=87 /DNA_END=1454 /DNA_ORIENTATION=+
MQVESVIFGGALVVLELFLIAVLAVWSTYPDDDDSLAVDLVVYPFFRDVSIMIFFGFGLLMTFLRRFGYSAIGYSLFIAAFVCQYSIILELFFVELDESKDFNERREVGVLQLLNGLFAAATVLISYGAVLGKVSPMQLVVLAVIEPFFYWLNIFIGVLKLEALDIGGGMFIHTFGAYFGLAVCWFLTSSKTRGHPDNVSNYSGDIFSLIGTLFLWILWPSFNAAIAEPGTPQVRAIVNTFLSLCGATVSSFVVSRWVSKHRFEVVHIQNSTLAGGVAMGVIADLDINPAGAIASGFLVGAISVLGYRWLTPFLSQHLNIQDVCGVHNLHGIPGILGSIIGVFVILGLSVDDDEDFDPPHGEEQAGYNFAALVITLAIAIASGIFCGVIMWGAGFLEYIFPEDFYHDRTYWQVPSDYLWIAEKEDQSEFVMAPMSRTGSTIVRHHNDKLHLDDDL